LTGTTERGNDPSETPLASAVDARNTYHFLRQRPAGVADGLAGNLLDRRLTSFRVATSSSTSCTISSSSAEHGPARSGCTRPWTMRPARACVGFLLVRGGVHIVAYAKALERLTGVDVGKLLPIPDISNKRFPEAAAHEAKDSTGSCISSVPRTTLVLAKSGTVHTRRRKRARGAGCVLQKDSPHQTSTLNPADGAPGAPTSTRRCFRTWPPGSFRSCVANGDRPRRKSTRSPVR
jgi:hypothetical protein